MRYPSLKTTTYQKRMGIFPLSHKIGCNCKLCLIYRKHSDYCNCDVCIEVVGVECDICGDKANPLAYPRTLLKNNVVYCDNCEKREAEHYRENERLIFQYYCDLEDDNDGPSHFVPEDDEYDIMVIDGECM